MAIMERVLITYDRACNLRYIYQYSDGDEIITNAWGWIERWDSQECEYYFDNPTPVSEAGVIFGK